MSRIGRMPITVPAGVTVTIADGNVVTVKGPKGELTRALRTEMIIKQEGDTITVTRPSDDKLHRSLHGLTRTLLNNIINAWIPRSLSISIIFCFSIFSPSFIEGNLAYLETQSQYSQLLFYHKFAVIKWLQRKRTNCFAVMKFTHCFPYIKFFHQLDYGNALGVSKGFCNG